jgi:hypothetical protein
MKGGESELPSRTNSRMPDARPVRLEVENGKVLSRRSHPGHIFLKNVASGGNSRACPYVSSEQMTPKQAAISRSKLLARLTRPRHGPARLPAGADYLSFQRLPQMRPW